MRPAALRRMYTASVVGMMRLLRQRSPGRLGRRDAVPLTSPNEDGTAAWITRRRASCQPCLTAAALQCLPAMHSSVGWLSLRRAAPALLRH